MQNGFPKIEIHSIIFVDIFKVQQPKVTSVLTEPQRALISTISDGQKAVEQAERILETKLEVPDLGTDPVKKKRIFSLCTS